MSDRGPNQDLMPLGRQPQKEDETYEDATYLGTSQADDVEVQDLGFIVEDHDDRRATLTDGWQRLDDLDTNEPLETNRSGPIPHEVSLRAGGVSEERFATDYHVSHALGEQQEEDFVATSMLETDPEMNAGMDDFTDETLSDIHGGSIATDLYGHVGGVAYGFGTSLPQDAGLEGFQIRDNPLMQDAEEPVSGEDVSDEALGVRDVDEMGSDEALDALADLAARDVERRGGRI
jgi:hypothetical protein